VLHSRACSLSHCYVHHSHLHSFPTRRSSDLTMIYEKAQACFGSNNCYLQAFEYMFILSKGRPKSLNFIRDRANKRSGVESMSARSEEHTSELQSRFDLVCRLLLEKKNKS